MKYNGGRHSSSSRWAAYTPTLARLPTAVEHLANDTVLPYFSESPFFDRTSNNATLSNQAMYNQSMYYVIQTRAAFEAHLRSMAGLEFMVIHDPSNNDTVRDHNGIWVISKQQRQKRPNLEDEVVQLSSYFVVGENVYMAPTVASVVESRLVREVAHYQVVLISEAVYSHVPGTALLFRFQAPNLQPVPRPHLF